MLKVSQVMVVSCCLLESRGASAKENSLLLLNLSLGTKNNKLYLNDVNCHAVIGCFSGLTHIHPSISVKSASRLFTRLTHTTVKVCQSLTRTKIMGQNNVYP